jgi:hypothetical protein
MTGGLVAASGATVGYIVIIVLLVVLGFGWYSARQRRLRRR